MIVVLAEDINCVHMIVATRELVTAREQLIQTMANLSTNKDACMVYKSLPRMMPPCFLMG